MIKKKKTLIISLLSCIMLLFSILCFTNTGFKGVSLAEDELANEFTNNSKMVISTDSNISASTYEIIDGGNETGLLLGYSGAVLKLNVNAGTAGARFDFSNYNIATKKVKSIVVRAYVPGFDASNDEFRTHDGTNWNTAYNGLYDLTGWVDITLNATSLSNLKTTGTNDELGYVWIGFRIKGLATVCYIDSITVNSITENAFLKEVGPYGWNNLVSNQKSFTLFSYNTKLGDNTNATNLASTENDLSLGVRFNGKTFYELYQTNNLYELSYANGETYFTTGIPESDLVPSNGYEYPTIEMDDELPFYNYCLSSNKFVFKENTWSLVPKYDDINFTGFVLPENVYNNKVVNNSLSVFITLECADLNAKNAQNHPDSVSGVYLNGVEITDRSKFVLWDANRFWIKYSDTDAVADANGFSNPTIEFNNAIINYDSRTYTIKDFKIYLNLDTGYWQSLIPEGYKIAKASSFDKFDSSSTNNYIVLNYTDEYTWVDDVSILSSKIILGDSTTLAQDGGSVSVDIINKKIIISTINTYDKFSIGKDAIINDIIVPEIEGYYYLDCWHTDSIGCFDGFTVATTGYTLTDNWNNTDNHFKTSIKLFDNEILDNNAYIGSSSNIYLNGVELTGSHTQVGNVTVMLIGVRKGLWIQFPNTFTTTNDVLGYSHLTLHFEQGASITNSSNSKTYYVDEFTLYLVDGSWTNQKPENYNVITPTEFISVDSTSTHNSVVLNFSDENIWTNDNGDVLNNTFVNNYQYKFVDNNAQADSCVNSLNAVLSIDKLNKQITISFDGSYDYFSITNAKCAGIYLPNVTLYYVNGSWVTSFNVELDEVGPWGWNNAGHDYNSSTPVGTAWTIFTFKNSSFISGNGIRVSSSTKNLASLDNELSRGIKLNGVSFYDLYKLNNQYAINSMLRYFMIQVPVADCVAKEGYLYPTLTIDDGIEFECMILPSFECILYKGKWINADSLTTSFSSVESESVKNISIYFDDDFTWGDSISDLSKILLDKTTLLADGGSATVDSVNRKITITTKGSYSKLTIKSGIKLGVFNLPETSLYYWDNAWHIDYKASLQFVGPWGWNNADSTFNNAIPAGITWTIVSYLDLDGNSLKFEYSSINCVGDNNLSKNIYLNGVSFYDLSLENSKLAITTQLGHLMFVIPTELLVSAEGFEYPTIEIKSGISFNNVILPELTIILYKGQWFNIVDIDTEPHDFTGIAYGWNNIQSGRYKDTILQFGNYELEFITYGNYIGDYLDKRDNGSAGHNDASNQATTGTIGLTLTINGIAIRNIPGAVVSYAHGFCYFYISVPEFALIPTGDYPVTTLHIEQDSLFMTSVLNELTLYLVNGVWTIDMPEIITNNQEVYITINDLTGQNEVVLTKEDLSSNNDEISTTISTNNIVIKYIFSSTSEIFNYNVLSNYSSDFGGIKVNLFSEGDSRLNAILFFNNQQVSLGSCQFASYENYAIRLAISLVNKNLKIVLSIDGVIIADYSATYNGVLGDKFAIRISDFGSYKFSDYKTGDIKIPIIYWEGKAIYTFNEDDDMPNNNLFIKSLYLADNADYDTLDRNNAIITWEDGAIVNNKLQLGLWSVKITVSDSSNNFAYYIIKANVVSNLKVIVTFDDFEVTTYQKGQLLSEPSTPIKIEDEYYSYTFDGWYYNNQKWDFKNNIVLTDMFLEARFLSIKKIHQVSVVSSGLDENYQFSLTLEYGAKLNKTLLDVDGYSYEVYINNNAVGSVIVDGDINVKVVYTKIGSNDDVDDPNEKQPKDQDGSGCSLQMNITSYGLISLCLFGIAVCIKNCRKKGENENE